MMEAPFIQLDGVWKEYQLDKIRLTVLRDINLAVEKGIFLAILGQSGSGKSTLLHIIGALDSPTQGKVFFEGTDLSQLPDNQLADIRSRKVGFVFQQFNLLPALSALENVMTPAVFQGIPQRTRMERARKVLTAVGLSHRMNHRPSELSGGEQQRVAISRALINEPDVIVADEPTGNIDSQTGKIVMDILTNLNKKEGKTIIVVTHEKSLASYADKVINIKDGQILQ